MGGRAPSVDIRGTFGPLVHGGGDPAHRTSGDGVFWWACRTPDGPGTLALRQRAGVVDASAWGAGAAWLLDRVPVLLGAAMTGPASRRRASVACRRGSASSRAAAAEHWSRPRRARTRHPRAARHRPGGAPRLARRVLLVRRSGARALAGAAGAAGRRDAARRPDWDWHRLGVDLARQRTIRGAATVAGRLEQCVDLAPVGRGPVAARAGYRRVDSCGSRPARVGRS